MNPKQLAQEIAALYPAVYHRLHARWHKGEQRPSPEALAILSHLELAGPLTVSEAARHFQRAQSAMSELIDRLQARGYVERVRDARDRRRTLVWMTDAGIAVLQRSRRVLDADMLARCIERMPERERRCLLEGLQSLVGAADALLKTRRSTS